jgi:outer membrane lipoprotein-sorting protein
VKYLRVWMVFLLVLAALPEAACGSTVFVAQVTDRHRDGVDTTLETGTIWTDRKVRFRSKMNDPSNSPLRIVNGADAWILSTSARMGYHAQKPSGAFELVDSLRRDVAEARREMKRRGGKRTGSARIGGKMCDVYVRNEQGTVMTSWVARKTGLPLRMTVKGEAKLGSTILKIDRQIDYRNWNETPSSPGLFRPPAGYRIQRAGPTTTR